MRIIADENVSSVLVDRLRAIGVDVLWILESHRSMADPDILRHATEQKRILLTFDADFGALAVRDERPAPYGIIFPRLKRLTLAETVERVFTVLSVSIDADWKIVVIEEDKLRIRDLRPSEQDTNP